MDLSIVIVSYNTKKLLLDCIESIQENTRGVSYEIIVVDNGSTDKSYELLSNFKFQISNFKLIRNELNYGFARANNQGWKVAKGKYILFLNSDTAISDNVLAEIVLWMDKNPKVGVSSCALKNKDGSLQGTGGYFPTLLSVFSWMTIQDFPFVDLIIPPFHPLHTKSFFSKGEGFYKKEKEVDWVTGAFLLTRRKLLEKVGGWSEDYFMYVEEVDLCFRIKKLGQRVWYNPKWSLVHYGGASSETREFPLLSEYQGVKTFYKKHYPSWQYPILRLLLKIGALGRVVLFGILEGRKGAEIYAKAAREA